MSDVRDVWPGRPFPLGPTWDGEGTNFSLFSEHAERVELCLFDAADGETRVELTGTLIVARDAAHARLKKMLDEGKPMPQYFKDHPIYYAGPAKTPAGMPSGSFGPTTAGRMDSFVDLFQSHGASLVMIAKGNRSKAVTDACKKHGGFYLGSIGGPAAVLRVLAARDEGPVMARQRFDGSPLQRGRDAVDAAKAPHSCRDCGEVERVEFRTCTSTASPWQRSCWV